MNFPPEEAPASVEPAPIAEEAQQRLKEQFSVTQQHEVPCQGHVPTMPTPAQTPTTQVSDAASETESTDPTTPSPAVTPQPAKCQPTPTTQPRTNKPTVPVIPAVPILPVSPKTSRHTHRDSVNVVSSTSQTAQLELNAEQARRSSTTSVPATSDISPELSAETPKPISPPAPPKSWADLVRSKTLPKTSSAAAAISQLANGLGPARSETLSDVLNAIHVTATNAPARIPFLKPRGLVNAGNMCYMNSVCVHCGNL
jgi:ubiquitin carboxyl-terminal hydrolase 10